MKIEWKNGDKCIYEGNLYDYQCISSWDKDACVLSGSSPLSKPFTDAWIDELSKPETPQQREERERLEAVKEMFSYWSDDEVDFNSGDEDDRWVKELLFSLYCAGYRKVEL